MYSSKKFGFEETGLVVAFTECYFDEKQERTYDLLMLLDSEPFPSPEPYNHNKILPPIESRNREHQCEVLEQHNTKRKIGTCILDFD